ncbi:MAG TPA: hypothetical protein VN642_05360 [Dongiaceae bacterium]|nr:hypothetical protein [Dongiaceae bacterium]
MEKFRFNRLGFMFLSLATLLIIEGCGGGSSSPGGSNNNNSAAKANISGTVSFPSLNSLLGKQVAKSVAAVLAPPTVELRDLNGKVVVTKSATGTGTSADPFSYSFTDIDTADYLVKATSGSKVIKAIVDKNSLATATTRDVDTISTTTVIIAEKKLGATLGTLGETASAEINSSAIETTVNPTALESSIKTAVNTVQYAAGTATQANINLVNLVNVVSATVNNDVDPAKFIDGKATLPSSVTTTQFTASTVATGGTQTAIVQSSVKASLQTTADAYIPPPKDSVYFINKVYDYNTNPAGVPLGGVAVTTAGLSPEITTLTDANGLFILAGVPQNTPFSIRMSKATYADAYSNNISLTGSQDNSDRPYALYLPAKLVDMGNSAGNGVIRSRVVISTNQVSGFIGGAVVTATDKASSSTTYPVKYIDSTTGKISSTLTSTDPVNGQYVIVNVPAGHTVNVTAAKSGFTFNTRTFLIHADAVSESRIVGTVAATTPSGAGSLLAALQSGLNEINVDSSFNPATGVATNFYTIQRVGIAADGASLTETIISYYDRATKTWTSSAPAGFSTNNNNPSDLALTSSGTWVKLPDGPQGSSIVFNADGSARMTNPINGEIEDIVLSTVDLSGQPISAAGPEGAPLLATAAPFPAGSLRFDLTLTSVNGSYEVFSTYSQLTSLASVPAAFAESAGPQIFIESFSGTDFFYAKFANGSTTNVNIYRGTSGTTGAITTPQLIATASAATVTVSGQQLLEISIPASVRTTYKLSRNPIFAVVNGVVMQGDHTLAGAVDSSGTHLFNDAAINHIKANINTALLKPAVAKNLSKAILGR